MSKDYSQIPSVNEIINQVKKVYSDTDSAMLTQSIRVFLDNYRRSEDLKFQSKTEIINSYLDYLKNIFQCPLKPVINATGILLHTNLGRAPYGKNISEKVTEICSGYTNVEFNLSDAGRAYRDDLLKDIFGYVTGSQDFVVVNNNAAAVYLILKHYAQGKEVIVSRGELIEIGGSFRIPDMMRDSGAILKEVGTTNCTRLNDYKNAINENTGLIFKAHTSNYIIKGHTQSVEIDDLVKLSKEYNIPFVYDAGSGLLNKHITVSNTKLPSFFTETEEPDISECIAKGIDIVCFSGDKILGASQAGIILGKQSFLKPLKKHPLMRVLRVDKFTIASLYHTVLLYANPEKLFKDNYVYSCLSQSRGELLNKAQILSTYLTEEKIQNSIIETYECSETSPLSAQIGGGTFPEKSIAGFLVRLDLMSDKNIKPSLEEKLYLMLLKLDKPVLVILKEAKIYLNIFTVQETDLSYIAKNIRKVLDVISTESGSPYFVRNSL